MRCDSDVTTQESPETQISAPVSFCRIYPRATPLDYPTHNSSPLDTPPLPRSSRDSILWRNLAVVRAAWTMVDATMGCFRRVAYSASVGLDASVMAWCTEIQTGKGRVVVNETAAGGTSGEASRTIFRGHTPCYTSYSCIGLLGVSQWSWPVWCSVVCYVCGALLEVVSGADSSPTTSLPPWEGLRINQAINDNSLQA
jgi:hypothetical protein